MRFCARSAVHCATETRSTLQHRYSRCTWYVYEPELVRTRNVVVGLNVETDRFTGHRVIWTFSGAFSNHVFCSSEIIPSNTYARPIPGRAPVTYRFRFAVSADRVRQVFGTRDCWPDLLFHQLALVNETISVHRARPIVNETKRFGLSR